MTLTLDRAGFTLNSNSFTINRGSAGTAGIRSVIGIITEATISVTDITEYPGGAPGGFTLRSSSSAQGETWWLYDKICVAGEPQVYTVSLSGTAGWLTIGILADFSTGGDAIRAVGYADNTNAATLTLPSLTAARADDIYTFGWALDLDGLLLQANSPLTTRTNTTFASGGILTGEAGHQSWQSSSATGTRSYTMSSSGVYDLAFGAIVLVGDYDPPPTGGGWGVGQVRMGAN